MSEQHSHLKRYAVVAVVRREEKFLVIQRSLTEIAPGAFCFPGGAIEHGESEEAALLRELDEELAIKSASPVRCVWRSTTERNVEIAWWSTRLAADVEMAGDPQEVAAIHWWTPREMFDSGNMLRSNLLFLRALELGDILLDQ